MRASGSMSLSAGLSGALKSLSSDMKSASALQGDFSRLVQDQNNPQKLQADLKQLFQDAKNPQKLMQDLKKLLQSKLPQDVKAQLEKILQEMDDFAKKYFGDSFTPAGKGGGGGGGGGKAAGAGGGGGGGGAGGASGAGGGGGGAGGAGGADGGGGAGGAGGADGGGGASQAGGADGAGGTDGTGQSASATGPAGIQTNSPQIAQALQQIASDPVGAKLLAAAQANGLTSITANTSLNPSGGAGLQGQTVTGANGKPQIQIANPNSPDLIHTIVHELGHAATTADGDSKAEEMLVDKLGSEVQQRLTGRADPSNLDMSAYTQLADDNGIANDLAKLGIAA